MAFKNLSNNPLYDNFRRGVKVDGIWDDHDMGINDGGRHVNNLKERQNLFINYITGDHQSANTSDRSDTEVINNEESSNTSPRAINSISDTDSVNREGEDYHKRDHLSKMFDKKFGKNGPNVRFILLDTRSHRDYHYIRSLGEIKFPLTPIIAAFVRAAYSVIGLGREHAGDFYLSLSMYQITSNP